MVANAGILFPTPLIDCELSPCSRPILLSANACLFSAPFWMGQNFQYQRSWHVPLLSSRCKANDKARPRWTYHRRCIFCRQTRTREPRPLQRIEIRCSRAYSICRCELFYHDLLKLSDSVAILTALEWGAHKITVNSYAPSMHIFLTFCSATNGIIIRYRRDTNGYAFWLIWNSWSHSICFIVDNFVASVGAPRDAFYSGVCCVSSKLTVWTDSNTRNFFLAKSTIGSRIPRSTGVHRRPSVIPCIERIPSHHR